MIYCTLKLHVFCQPKVESVPRKLQFWAQPVKKIERLVSYARDQGVERAECFLKSRKTSKISL